MCDADERSVVLPGQRRNGHGCLDVHGLTGKSEATARECTTALAAC